MFASVYSLVAMSGLEAVSDRIEETQGLLGTSWFESDATVVS